jgi:hypothetical protein
MGHALCFQLKLFYVLSEFQKYLGQPLICLLSASHYAMHCRIINLAIWLFSPVLLLDWTIMKKGNSKQMLWKQLICAQHLLFSFLPALPPSLTPSLPSFLPFFFFFSLLYFSCFLQEFMETLYLNVTWEFWKSYNKQQYKIYTTWSSFFRILLCE